MAEELNSLIEKIQKEGVEAAEEKAKSIEEKARQKADSIIKEAKSQTEGLIEDAKGKIARMEESGKELLKQAGRDLMLSLKKEVNNTLDKLVVSHVQEALSPEDITKMIASLLKNIKAEEKKDIIISLSPGDSKKLEESLLKELKGKTKDGITLKPSEEIRGGFLISYDKGKSHYDFSDKSLAEYLASYVKPRLSEMLKDISPDEGKKKKK